MSAWSELPIELLECIAQRLDILPHLLSFSSVCVAWRLAGSRKSHQFRHQPPLLMLPGEGHTRTRKFFSFPKEVVFSTHLPQIYRKNCCGSSKGWLALLDAPRSEVKLFNPFSRVEIQLPPLTKFPYPADSDHPEKPRANDYIHKVILSCDPTQSSDCIVMAIVSLDRLLAFCRPGDESWTALETPYVAFDDVIHYKGLFYGIDFQADVVACDVSGEPKVTATIPYYREELPSSIKYFVESAHGNLLLVFRRINREDPDDPQMSESMNRYRRGYLTVDFKVVKLDVEEKKWIKLSSDHMRDQILFLGNGESISLSARDLPGWRGNSIYFVDDNACAGYRYFVYGCHDMGVFNFEDRSIQPFSLNNSSWFDPLIWVTQNP